MIDAHVWMARNPGVPDMTEPIEPAIPPPRGITLEPLRITMGVGSLVTVLTPMSHSLLAQARIVANQNQQQFAVVLAQVACELRTEEAIIDLMRLRKAEVLSEALLGIFDTKSMADDRLRKVFIALACDDPAQAAWWSDWKESRKLRHGVAHRAASVTADQAALAIESADKFIAHVTNVVERMRAANP
jgi:Tfp pilus assembly protein PilX